MSGSPRRRRPKGEEPISGQYRVSVPDAAELDQLRTRGGTYRRGLYTTSGTNMPPPDRTQSLPTSSRESSTEPMDTDDARRISEEIHRRLRSPNRGEVRRRNSFGDLPSTRAQSHLSPVSEGRGSQATEGDQTVRMVPPRGDLPQEGEGATGGETLLTIPSISTVGGGEAENQTLARPPMKNPTTDIERRGGARSKRGPTYTTQTIQEEARAARTEDEARQLRGTNFYLPIVGQPRISQLRSWRGPVLTDQGNPGVYVQIEEWLSLYNTNLFVVDEITGRMYACRGKKLEAIPEVASHRPMEDHELSASKNVPEREDGGIHPSSTRKDATRGEPGELGEAQQAASGEVGEVGRTPIPVAESTRQPVIGEQSPWPTAEPVAKPPDSPRVSGEDNRPTIILSRKNPTNQQTSHHAGGEKGEPPGKRRGQGRRIFHSCAPRER